MIKQYSSKILAATAAVFLVAGSAFAANVNVPRTITADTTWTADNVYFLEGYTFVINNATLTIEPGTLVKGRVSSGVGAASLIITRGSKIMAEGTAENPIIFTSELDELNGNLTAADTGLWGGIIVLGHATINSRANSEPAGVAAGWNEDQIEGVSVSGDEIAYATFGGTNDADNSGVMRYMSVRHGGALIGGDNEINGMTFGGVGSGTVLEYCEVFANKDDSFEWFGGTMNARYLVSSFGNDDSFDVDQGFRGNLQFMFSIQTDVQADRGDKTLEWDGATSPLDALPKGAATISNLTAIGIGTTGRDNTAINVRDNINAKIYNSVFVNFTKMLDIENDIGTPLPDIKNNLWFSHIAANNNAEGLLAVPSRATDQAAYFTNAANGNVIADPMLIGITYAQGAAGLDPRPALASPARTGTVQAVSGSGLVAVDYKGAFKNNNWMVGWTKLSEALYLNPNPPELEESTGDPDDAVVINRGSPSKPVNISTRGFVGTGNQVMTAGFVITGPETQSVLIRAVGPSLAGFGLTGVLADPKIEVFSVTDTNTPIRTNQKYGPRVATIGAEVGAFALEADSADAGLIMTLAPGAYTAVVTGVDGGTGIALIEVYEID